jgi:hypothetical protein
MKKPGSMKGLEELGRVRLSESFFMKDFLYSEIANFYGIRNFPDDPDLAIKAGEKLCGHLLEPLQKRFGRISIRSAYRSKAVNQFGNENKLNCASNKANYGRHIWDMKDEDGNIGAMACIVVNSFIPYYEKTDHWQAMAWWVHDHLPYDEVVFYPRMAAFNISWNELPKRIIKSYVPPNKGTLTKPGDANHHGKHETAYADMLAGMT